MPSKKKLGIIVNPIAGIGGRVGLKGSDGADILRRAIKLGAVPPAPARTVQALRRIASEKHEIDLVTYPCDMGEYEARECGLEPCVIGSITRGRTTSDDTKRAAKEMLQLKVDLILFAGGDGTARDICEAANENVPVLGIPTGIKMHSGVFAISPRVAGDLVVKYLLGKAADVREAEVMDIDEQAFRENRVSAKLYGYVKVPYDKILVQGAKAGSGGTDEDAIEEIAYDIMENMNDDHVYIIGPGTTTRPIVEKLGLKKTLLGVDVLHRRTLLASDANEDQLLKILEANKAKIVVTVIGGQGFIFGRGNQQISPDVIRRVGKENILVIATPCKLASLQGAPLLLDTGDEKLDRMLSGYFRVTTGYGKAAMYKAVG